MFVKFDCTACESSSQEERDVRCERVVYRQCFSMHAATFKPLKHDTCNLDL